MPRVAKAIGSIPPPTTFAAATGIPANKKRQQPRAYGDNIARKICERIMQGETLNAICADPRMPSKPTVIRWLASPTRADFREMYYYARRVYAELLMDEVIEIADDQSKDWIPTYNKKGEQNGWKPDNEAIQRSRVRIDTRKWLASKMIPRIYGEKVDHHHEVVGDLAELLKTASNKDSGLPPPIKGN